MSNFACNCTTCMEEANNKPWWNFPSFSELGYGSENLISSPGEFTFIWQSKWVRVLICDENWKKANSLFKRCCCCCHHPWIITSLIQWSLNVMTGQGTRKLKYLCYNKVLLYQGSFLYIFFSWGLKNSSLYRSRTLL